MLSQTVQERLIKELAPAGYTPRQESEANYAPRGLPAKAEVMRVPPSPTGFVHIGTIYAGLVNERIAHQSGGVFILRVEDTDKKREVEGAIDQIVQAFEAFELPYDEGPQRAGGVYGPYVQSERAALYLGYAVDLIERGRAYPCFATADELAALIAQQREQKVRPGYYGKWAIWRGKSEAEIVAALDAGKPFVLRFRSEGSHAKRFSYTDVLKGKMTIPENDLDVPLIKSDDSRLPTYHLAHVVDDTLMRVTKVFRSDEWLPSTALHIELSTALGLNPFVYGHFAPISIIDAGGGKRKLSKRKDAAADVRFWLEAGYPIGAIKAYLLGLANSNFEDWYRQHPDTPLDEFPFSIEKLAASRAPLLDMQKLEAIAKNWIGRLPQTAFDKQLLDWAEHYAPYLVEAARADQDYAQAVLALERGGENARKDLAKWSDAPEQYGYFFDQLFAEHFAPRIPQELTDIALADQQALVDAFLASYNAADEQPTWFEKLKAAATQAGFATDNKAYQANPEQFRGSLADAARVLRVKLTGKNRTPDLWSIMQLMGKARVSKRLNSPA